MTRDERQEQNFKKWIISGCRSTIVCPTGYGKSRVGIMAIKWLLGRRPAASIIVIVPTITLKEQWDELLKEMKDNCKVIVINTVIKDKYDCDLLILDEVHRYPADTFSQVFYCIEYTGILCLTATFERIDGKHILIEKYAPICDEVTLEECITNGWISTFKEYTIFLKPKDHERYQSLSKEFNNWFEKFDFSFPLLLSLTGKTGHLKKMQYARDRGYDFRQINAAVVNAMRCLGKRKAYIDNHPEKIEIAKMIIDARKDKKIITFSSTRAMAEALVEATGGGEIYDGSNTKKENRKILEEFKEKRSGVLHTVKMAEVGLDVPDIDVGIRLGLNSSRTTHTQTRGRVIRKYANKVSEFYSIVLKDTIEVAWWKKAIGDNKTIILTPDNLKLMLSGQRYRISEVPVKQYLGVV